jgi:hypothetical protein
MDYENSPNKAFNKAFKFMLKDLKRTFPNMNELKIIYAGYKIIKALNKKMVHDLWKEVAETPYGEYLKRHDASFFVDPDFKPAECLSPAYAALVPSLVETWRHLDDGNKSAIWKHIDVLLALSAKVP